MSIQDRANALLRDELGGLRLALIQQQAELEALRAENAALKAEMVKAKLWNGEKTTTEEARAN